MEKKYLRRKWLRIAFSFRTCKISNVAIIYLCLKVDPQAINTKHVIAFIKSETIFAGFRHETNVAIEVSIAKLKQCLIFVIIFA
jgi:hypothetical protein